MVNRRFTAGLIATGSLVNVAEQRLKDTQSQGTLNSKQENINAMTRDETRGFRFAYGMEPGRQLRTTPYGVLTLTMRSVAGAARATRFNL